MKKINQLLVIAVILCIGMISCKKDRVSEPDQNLIGEWHMIDVNGHFSRLIFKQKADFIYSISIQGEPSYVSTFYGSFRVKSDSLKVSLKEKVEEESGKKPIRTPFAGDLFEAATYTIKQDTLSLSYISYPADAPVRGTVKFKRALSFGDDIVR